MSKIDYIFQRLKFCKKCQKASYLVVNLQRLIHEVLKQKMKRENVFNFSKLKNLRSFRSYKALKLRHKLKRHKNA